MSKRVAVYARVSTTRQAENDISIPDQLAQARRYCGERGWYVAKEFVDPGASARDDKRPQFQALMDSACVDPSPYDVVLVHSQSRFFRDTAGYVVSKRRLQKHGVTLTSITQDFGEGAAAEFAETVIAASDALHSAETGKHVTRTMLENARQGFWNGSIPPFGYRAITVEQRGNRSKKRLEIEPKDAEVVRLVYRLFLEGDGARGRLGVKDITSWLNQRGFKNKSGNAFFMSLVHRTLTRETYTGVHHYNQTDSRTFKTRPKEEWVAMSVPEIIPRREFERAQALLFERRPTQTAPRLVTSDVLLTGLARCASCGGPMMIRTGKSGRYRYYACAAHRLKGKTSCKAPMAVPEGQLDTLVVEALAERLMTPDRLAELLRQAYRHQRETASDHLHRRSTLRKALKEIEVQIERLHSAVAEGTVPDTSLLRQKLSGFEERRTETIRLLSLLDSDVQPLRRALSKQQAATVAANLKRRLLDAPSALRKNYVRGIVSEIIVDRDKATISGPKAAIASALSNLKAPEPVRSFDRNWRSHGESNPGFSLERAAS